MTNGFAPEFGRSTGGLLNVVTKSGTNDLKGSAHWYHRNESAHQRRLAGDSAQHRRIPETSIGAAIWAARSSSGTSSSSSRPSTSRTEIRPADHQVRSRRQRCRSAPSSASADLGDARGLQPAERRSCSRYLGKWDYQVGDSDHVSVRTFHTSNQTDGFHRRPGPEPDPGLLRQHREVRELAATTRSGLVDQGDLKSGRGLQRVRVHVLGLHAATRTQRPRSPRSSSVTPGLRPALLPADHR